MSLQFGTSGWRAVLAEEFTFVNARLVCRAIAEHVVAEATHAGDRGAPVLLVGYDARFLSERFALAAADALAAGGARPMLCDGPAPTPAVASYVVRHRLAGAVTITAAGRIPVLRNEDGLGEPEQCCGQAQRAIHGRRNALDHINQT